MMKQVALNIIKKAFANKKDKAGKPYIDHLKRVAENAKNYFGGCSYIEDLEIIALLHDLLEDCPEWTKEHLLAIFDVQIVNSVDRLTKKDGITYKQYIHNILNDRYTRAVKLADLEDNMNLTRLRELKENDIERIKKYHESYRYLLEYGK